MGVTELQINGFADFYGIKDMASKTRYTEEFKKKVVEEYKIGDLSLEEVATKHGLPPVLLQDWVNKDKDDVNNIFIRYVERSKEKTSIFSLPRLKQHVSSLFKISKRMAGCWQDAYPYLYALQPS